MFRNLFLTAGDDGLIRLFHIFDTNPIKQWEPVPGISIPGKILVQYD